MIEAHKKLYISSINDFCQCQQKLLEYLDHYKDINCGNLSDSEIDELYEEFSDDDDYSVCGYTLYGSKQKYLENEFLSLIYCYKESVQEYVNISFKRLDVLLDIIGRG